MLSGVRPLTMEEHNQARRFTNLVDAVYDRNAKLVLVSDESDVRIDTLLEGVTKLQDVRGESVAALPVTIQS